MNRKEKLKLVAEYITNNTKYSLGRSQFDAIPKSIIHLPIEAIAEVAIEIFKAYWEGRNSIKDKK